MKTILTTLLLLCLLATQSFPQWFWQNPTPHGNSNNRFDFSSASSFTVVGNSGTIVKTTNNGISWQRQFSPRYENLNDIDYIDSEKAIIVGANGTILRTYNGGNTWDDISTGINTNLTAVKFLNSTDGIITGWNGLILWTTDGGDTWGQRAAVTDKRLYGISFANSTTGMVVGDGGVILKTVDGGQTWNQLTSGTPQSLYDVSYVTSSVAVAAGWGGTIIRTTNGGSTWNPLGLNIYIQWGVSFTDSDNGVIVGDANSISRTTDGGVNWTYPYSQNLATNFHCVKFYNSNVGVAVGEYGAIFRTTDAGETWQILTKGSLTLGGNPDVLNRNDLYSVQCINSNRAVITGSSEIFFTNNGGVSWNNVWMFNYPRIDDVSFTTTSIGVIIGRNQNLQGSSILKTVNGGSDWSVQHNSSSGILNSIKLSTTTHGIAVGNAGKILRTSDGGQNWDDLSVGGSDLYDLFLVDSLYGYAVGRYGVIIKTTNGGTDWEAVLGNNFYTLYGVAFSDANNGIAVGDSIKVGVYYGLILKTTNGGTSWSRQVLDVPLSLTDVTFANSNSWHAIGYSAIPGTTLGRIYKSEDAGGTWNEQTPDINISRIIKKISAFDANNLLIVGNGGALIKGVNGGVPNQAINNTLTNLNLPVNNGQNATSTMTFTPPGDQPVNTNLSENIVSVEVTINEVLHTRTGDLTFTLEHNGVSETIIIQVGGDGENFISTVLTDNASVPIANGVAPFTGLYLPSNPLSVFNGMNAYGDWTLTVIDGFAGNDGILNSWSLQITLDSPNDIEDENDLTPNDFVLHQNYPNPFNPSTIISFYLPERSDVTLKVYNILGSEVATLLSEEKSAGSHNVTFNTGGLSGGISSGGVYASGVYFYRLQAGSFVETKKMILLK